MTAHQASTDDQPASYSRPSQNQPAGHSYQNGRTRMSGWLAGCTFIVHLMNKYFTSLVQILYLTLYKICTRFVQ